MMNLIVILACSILLPASTMCGENVSENTSHSNNKYNSLQPTKSNSSHSLTSNVIVKREIPEANEMPYYHIPTAIMSKRSATVLNKLMFALRNSFDKSAIPVENELGSRETENFSGDGSQALTRGATVVDRFPAALVERRGQKDRKIYLRCYFNAVSCFKRK